MRRCLKNYTIQKFREDVRGIGERLMMYRMTTKDCDKLLWLCDRLDEKIKQKGPDKQFLTVAEIREMVE